MTTTKDAIKTVRNALQQLADMGLQSQTSHVFAALTTIEQLLAEKEVGKTVTTISREEMTIEKAAQIVTEKILGGIEFQGFNIPVIESRMLPIIEEALRARDERSRIVWNDAIEAAAKICEENSKVYKSSEYAYPSGCLLSQLVAQSQAADIRMLAKE